MLLVSLSAHAKTLVVSDIDDTIKRTNVLGYFTGGLRTTNSFIGLPELYSDYLCNGEHTQEKVEYCKKFRGHNHSQDRSLIYVTAAPGRLQMFGREFISRSNFPEQTVIGKKIGDETLAFKIRVIKEIVLGGDYDEVILIGDNGENDVVAYRAITDYFSKKRITTFIHQVYDGIGRGVELSKGQRPYFTASDLALEFFSKGLISERQLIAIAKKVNKYISSFESKVYEQVVPSWSSCAGFLSSYKRPKVDLSRESKKLLDLIEKRLSRLCH